MSLEQNVKTVKELTNEIKNTLESAFPYIWVKGELGSVKLHSSGHRYFSLKEDDCVINGICWRGTPLSIDLEEGKIVECYAKVTIFGGRSSYQIIAKEIREVSSKGDILLKLEELKKKLREEGVFNLKSHHELVPFPRRIAILTSPTGAVWHDMMHRINDRFACLEVVFLPINVQGADSKKSILEGLNRADFLDVDIIILARGGGSLEDLWVFNDEDIVRKVATLKKAIVTAVGHETDTTLVDYAANLRAPTPTAAIELCIPDKSDLKKDILSWFSSSIILAYEKLSNFNKVIDQFSDSNLMIDSAIETFYQRLDSLIFNSSGIVKDRLKKIELFLAEFESDSIDTHVDKVATEILSLYVYSCELARIRSNQLLSNLEQQGVFISEMQEEFKEKVIIVSKENKRIYSADDVRRLDKQAFSLNFIDGSIMVSEE